MYIKDKNESFLYEVRIVVALGGEQGNWIVGKTWLLGADDVLFLILGAGFTVSCLQAGAVYESPQLYTYDMCLSIYHICNIFSIILHLYAVSILLSNHGCISLLGLP